MCTTEKIHQAFQNQIPHTYISGKIFPVLFAVLVIVLHPFLLPNCLYNNHSELQKGNINVVKYFCCRWFGLDDGVIKESNRSENTKNILNYFTK